MTRLTLAALALMGSVSVAQAQDAGLSYMSVDDINLVNAAGDKIGEIEEILVDASGSPAAVLIDFGGFLGIGDRDAALPLSSVTFSDGMYQTQLSQDDLRALPEWDD